MKKTLLIIAIAGLTFAACKKDRTCTCTYTEVSGSSTEPNYTFTPDPPRTTTDRYTKIKKNNVYAELCVTNEQTSSYPYTSFNGTTTVTYVRTTVTKNECTLK